VGDRAHTTRCVLSVYDTWPFGVMSRWSGFGPLLGGLLPSRARVRFAGFTDYAASYELLESPASSLSAFLCVIG
jgi:hypothetical protein